MDDPTRRPETAGTGMHPSHICLNSSIASGIISINGIGSITPIGDDAIGFVVVPANIGDQVGR